MSSLDGYQPVRADRGAGWGPQHRGLCKGERQLHLKLWQPALVQGWAGEHGQEQHQSSQTRTPEELLLQPDEVSEVTLEITTHVLFPLNLSLFVVQLDPGQPRPHVWTRIRECQQSLEWEGYHRDLSQPGHHWCHLQHLEGTTQISER